LTLREVGVPPAAAAFQANWSPNWRITPHRFGGKNEANGQFGEPSNLAEAGRGIPPLLE
jgi:hypothetical protein